MKKARLWYVIADGGRARFVECDDQGAFRTLSSFVSTELHTSAHELGRDRPARVKESASPARSAIEPRRDLHEAAKEDFIRAVADTLAAGLKDEKFDELVLVAPPGVIAERAGEALSLTRAGRSRPSSCALVCNSVETKLDSVRKAP